MSHFANARPYDRWGVSPTFGLFPGPASGEALQGSPLRTAIVVLICLTTAGINLYAGAGNNYYSLGILVAVMCVAFYPHRNTSLGAVVLFSAVTLFIVPTYALLFVNAGVAPAWFALFILVAMTLIRLIGADPVLPAPAIPFRHDLLLVGFMVFAGLLSQYLALPEQVFHAFWGISLVHLERLHVSTTSMLRRLTGVFLILLMVILYSVLFWGGFGRLILASFALAPLLLTIHYGTFRLNFLLFAGGAGALVFIGRVLRFGWSDGVAGLADDSGASPLTLSQGLWEQSASVIYQEPLWHQWSLLFVQWFPRALWPDKPIGLNYTLVDVVLGRQGLGEEHSTAVGYFGEHIFLIKDWWLLSAAVLTLVIAATSGIVRKVGKSYAAPNVVFNVWLVTLFWGGMADFGSRVWFSLVPALAYIYLIGGGPHSARVGDEAAGLAQDPPGTNQVPADDNRDV